MADECCAFCFSSSRAKRTRKEELQVNLEGPVKGEDRNCTDLLWLLLFIVFWIGMIVVAVFSFREGNYKRLLYGVDSWGNVCNEGNPKRINDSNSGLDLSDRNTLYWLDPSDKAAPVICVPECPAITNSTGGSWAESCEGNVGDVVCDKRWSVCLWDGVGDANTPYRIHGASADSIATTEVDKGPYGNGCPRDIYDTNSKLSLHRCTPRTEIKTISERYSLIVSRFFSEVNERGDTLEKILSDFADSVWNLLNAAFVALVVSFVFLVMMYCCASAIVYSCVLLSVGMMGALAVFLGLRWWDIRQDLNDTPDEERFDGDDSDKDIYLALFIIASLLTLVLIIVVVAMRTRIAISIALFKEASKATMRMPQIYVTPFLTYITLLLLFAWWFWVFVYLASSWDSEMNEYGHYSWTLKDGFTNLWWYHLFGLVWTTMFILGCEQMVIAGAVSTWYFTRNKSTMSSPFRKAFSRLFRYHLGTVAIGSLVLAVVFTVKWILEYLSKKINASKASNFLKFLIKCIICCVWCFEACLKFFSKNAYIETAIWGYPFCKAGRQAFTLFGRNLLLVATVDFMANFVLFLCKLLVVGVVGLFSIAFLEQEENLHYESLVVLAICFEAYFIADSFFDVYRLAIDTILLCYVEDIDRHDGNHTPYYMSNNLLKFMKDSERMSNEAAGSKDLKYTPNEADA